MDPTQDLQQFLSQLDGLQSLHDERRAALQSQLLKNQALETELQTGAIDLVAGISANISL